MKNVTDSFSVTFPFSDRDQEFEDSIHKKLKCEPLFVDRLMSNVLALSLQNGSNYVQINDKNSENKKSEIDQKDEEIKVLKERIAKLANINMRLVEDANKNSFN